MRLSRLLRALPDARLLGEGDPEVTHVTLDSRRVRAGSLFVAVAGARADGWRFVPDALERGAVAVVGAGLPCDEVAAPLVVVADPRDAAGRLVATLHADLLEELALVGVTGTKGKTTTVRMVAAALSGAGLPCGSIGTLGAQGRDGVAEDLGNTTPDATRIAEVLAGFEASGHRAAALEASSQAAVQARVRHLPFRVLAFLNLSPEHAELHPTMAEYREAKAALFRDAAAVNPGFTAVVPRGDPDGEAMAAAAGAAARVVTFGEEDPEADVSGRVVSAGLAHLEVELAAGGASAPVRLGFGGRFNLQNLLAATACAHALEVPLERLVVGLEGMVAPRGRFELLERGGVHALVDYAHSANAMESLLASCGELVGAGRLLLVFGCGGEKDPGKRPKMGAAAAGGADLVWVTNDNPRREDPAAIAAAVTAGIPGGSRGEVHVELDRRAAIRAALDAARPGDLVVVAGKGHETTQTIGEETRPFDDREEILRYWAGER